MGDGCLEEGVSHEACSLAGHLGLGRLVAIYDDNHITIDGPTELALTDDPVLRFKGYGWHVIEAGEIANDLDALERAIREGMAEADRPSVIVLRSHIGWPSPKYTDTAKAHGEAIGKDADEVRAIKEIIGMDAGRALRRPGRRARVLPRRGRARPGGARSVGEGSGRVGRRASRASPRTTTRASNGAGVDGWASKLPSWPPGESIATRVACSDTLDAITDVVPGLVGGGADLTGNTGHEAARRRGRDRHPRLPGPPDPLRGP